jgi:DMSO/TMAO reductase YedYZ molybdopterin-dependent catalytic subunit
MTQNAQEAYEKGYADGVSMAEQMRWQGTPIGNILKGTRYQPENTYRAAYGEGFRQAMTAAHRIEWTPPASGEEVAQNQGAGTPLREALHS